MFSPLVDDILIVLALVFGPVGIWFTIGMAAIAIRAGQKSEKRVLQEIRQALRHPRHVHLEAVRFVVSPMSHGSSSSPPPIDEHPPHPAVHPPRRPKLPWRRPLPEVPSEVPWRPSPPEVDVPPSYQTRPGPVGPVVTRPEPGGSTVTRPAPSEHFVTRDPGGGFHDVE